MYVHVAGKKQAPRAIGDDEVCSINGQVPVTIILDSPDSPGLCGPPSCVGKENGSIGDINCCGDASFNRE